MTLLEMTNFVCERVGKTDATTAALVKKFIKARYRMIWDSCAWKDTQFVTFVESTKLAVNFDLQGMQYLFAPLCELVLPSQVAQVLGLRYGIGGSSGVKLDSYDAASLFGLNANAFTELGDIVAFTQLESSATRNVLNGKILSFSSSDELDTLISIEIEGNCTTDHDSLLAQPTTRRRETLVLDGTTPVLTENTYDFVYSISKPVTLGTITAKETAQNSWMVELFPEETSRSYIHLMVHRGPGLFVPPVNPNDGFFFILGKRQFYDITKDNSVPVIRGIDNALMTYATADLWERMRQFTKAQLKVAEADRLMAARMELERDQSGIVQLVPMIDQQFEPHFGGGYGIP